MNIYIYIIYIYNILYIIYINICTYKSLCKNIGKFQKVTKLIICEMDYEKNNILFEEINKDL